MTIEFETVKRCVKCDNRCYASRESGQVTYVRIGAAEGGNRTLAPSRCFRKLNLVCSVPTVAYQRSGEGRRCRLCWVPEGDCLGRSL